jgi:hypothetical protein
VGLGLVGEKDTSRQLIRDVHEMVVGANGDDSMLKELYLGDPFEEEDTDEGDDDENEDDYEEEEGTMQDVSYNNWGDEASFDWDRSEQVGQGWLDSGRIKSGIAAGETERQAKGRAAREASRGIILGWNRAGVTPTGLVWRTTNTFFC